MIPGTDAGRIVAPVVAALLAAVLAALSGGESRAAPMLRAGAAAVKITPPVSQTVYIAGYDNNRKAESVHDELWARALVLDDGTTRTAIVVCDLIGLSNYRVQILRRGVTAVPPEDVLIACTHVHSGPDTLGLWGPSAFMTGLNRMYLRELGDRVAAAADEAAKGMAPAAATVGAVDVPDGLVYNSREEIQDKRLTALRFTDPQGGTIATVVNYGGHPEVNKGHALTSDYVHYVREAVEKRFPGPCLFLNGALGGMVTPKISAHTFEEMQRVGDGVGASAVRALEHTEPIAAPKLGLRRRTLSLPLENERFRLAVTAGILDGDPGAAAVKTEVWRLDLGPVTMVSIPGEILPKPALALKAKMPGKYPMIVALGNDELGYILDPDDFDRKLYSYEKSMSVGKQTWPALFEAAQELLR